jgi:superfamily II DNA/RNA helicase
MLREGSDVVVHAPTGSGKTLVFELFWPSIKGQCVFTVPTRALANDKYAEWRKRGWDVGISTGDIAEGLDRKIIVATLETQRSDLLAGRGPRLLVIDEYQMIADPVRGVHYELAIALAPANTQLLLLSGSVSNPGDVAEWLRRIGRKAKLVSHSHRAVPLEEVDLSGLPDRSPAQLQGWWPRAIANALRQDLGPILLFAPRRKAAEQLATQLAATLPPCAPLHLDDNQYQLAGRTLNRLLKSRVAFHHSGLSFAQRSQLVEPLAKAGQLRVVVATMGLAAGINFSMRSVAIAGTTYLAGPFERKVTPAELLQMYGRAGRRGLDETGYALATPQPPRLADAQALPLRRSTQLDWPSLIAVMANADLTSQTPFAAASTLNQRLFSATPPPIGFERSLINRDAPCGLHVDAERARYIKRGVEQIWTPANRWESGANPRQTATLSNTLIWSPYASKQVKDTGTSQSSMHPSGRWIPAESVASVIAPLGKGTLCKLPGSKKRYGKEIHLGSRLGDGSFQLAKRLQSLLGKTIVTHDQLTSEVLPRISTITSGGTPVGLLPRGDQLFIHLSFEDVQWEAMEDSAGNWLRLAPSRKTSPESCSECRFREECTSSSAFTSPAHAWRELGLIEPDGRPNRRGIIFSFFQHGEGLAIAAALEDPTYPIADLVFDIADLRGGCRFGEEDGGELGRLALCCQRAFGNADYEGYLRYGIPSDYGPGAAEAVRNIVEHKIGNHQLLNERVRIGDIERAILEWRSLIRHIAYAPDYPWDRWRDLRAAAQTRASQSK